ncbi:hypothetical protein AB4Z54_50940 [Streptomyces sp. MCAF7]
MTPVPTEEVTTATRPPARTDRAVITAWSAVSPYGMGRPRISGRSRTTYRPS